MSKFYMMIGLPASGKSTEANKIAEENDTIIHASDLLREELFDTADIQEDNELVFTELHKRIKTDLRSGKNVIYDATNISYKRRKAFLQEIQKIDCQKIAVFIATPYEDCLKNNQQRERKVPEYVITKMYKNFYIPQMYEGWDKINIIWKYSVTDFPYDELKQKLDIQQDNPHHTLTVYQHCVKCKDLIKIDDHLLKIAALYHDIGKPFTKQFKNAKGEETKDAHYYQHHLVSAYDAIFYLRKELSNNDYILKIINYITWHMQPFFIQSEKAKDKFIKLVGHEFYDNLMILHEADKLAK